MALTHKTIIRRFVEGLTMQELAAKYNAAEWEIEEALRRALAPRTLPVQQEMKMQPSSPQLSIEEVYGSIEIK